MTHLPFVAGAYTLGIIIPLVLGISAWQRTTAARRKLAAIDPRQMREARR